MAALSITFLDDGTKVSTLATASQQSASGDQVGIRTHFHIVFVKMCWPVWNTVNFYKPFARWSIIFGSGWIPSLIVWPWKFG